MDTNDYDQPRVQQEMATPGKGVDRRSDLSSDHTAEKERLPKNRITGHRVAVQLGVIGRYLWAELRATTVATAKQSWRLVRHGIALARLAVLKRSLSRAQFNLEEELYEIGSGDPAMRDAVRELDDQIKNALEAKHSASKFIAERRERLINLAETSASTSDASPAESARERVLGCQRELEEQRGRLDATRIRLWPSSVAEIKRVGVGVGLSLMLLIAVIVFVSSHKPDSGSRANDTTAEVLAAGKDAPADGDAKRDTAPLATAASSPQTPAPAVAPFDAARAKQHQQAWASHLAASVEMVNSIGMKLRLIPPGEFMMGSPNSDTDADLDERPQHWVRVTKPFYLGVYEVTQAEYESVMESNPSSFASSGDRKARVSGQDTSRFPVENVSGEDAMKFCRKLSAKPGERSSGRVYRLPMEAEWEYACRAGSTSKYSFGDSEAELGKFAWYNMNSGKTTHPVGAKQANAWGLNDMQGNVWEWCQDAYSANDPEVRPDGFSRRVLRGGNWDRDGRHCRSADRGGDGQGTLGNLGRGFRVATVLADEGSGAIQVVEPPAQPEVKSQSKPPSTPATKLGIPLLAVAPFNAARAKQHQQAWASHLGVPVETINSIGMKLVLIPPGEFLMGSPDFQNLDGGETQHRVRITNPFYLGVYEVTQTQYQKVAGNNPSNFKGESLPVENVSWEDAVAFCKRLSEVAQERAAGYTYRLPTEAEWEYACRAGSTSQYSFGEAKAELEKFAWYEQNSDNTTHPVGRKQANGWGLCDMHGNVSEWCADWYGPYGAATVSDPLGTGSASDRVVRGGCWNGIAWLCRSAIRLRGGPANRHDNLGFRVAFSSVEASASKLRTRKNVDESPRSPPSATVPVPPLENADREDAKMEFLRKNAPMVIMGESLGELYKRHPDAKREVLKRNPDGSQELQWGGGLGSFQVLLNEDKVMVYHLRVLRIYRETAERYALEPREVFGEPLSTDLPMNDPKAVSCNRWLYNGYSLKTAVVMDRPIRGSAEYAYYSDLEVGNLDAIEAILGK